MIKQAQWETATIATTGAAAMKAITETIVTIGAAEMTETIVTIVTIGAAVMTVMTVMIATIGEAEPWMRKCSKCCRSKRPSARSKSSLASSLPLSLSLLSSACTRC